MDYLVKTGDFEGPIHILLQFIQERKLHVSEVSLATVTEDFLRFMAEHDLSHAHVSSFIVVSSTLILIKSRALLPTLELTEEEETSITDLTERVRQYEIIQRYAQYLLPVYLAKPLYPSTATNRTVPVFAPDETISLAAIEQTLKDLFGAFPVLEKIPEKTVKVVVKLEEMIESLRERIQKGMTYHTRDIMDTYRNATDPTQKRQAKVFAVVSFLAILELVKKGLGHVVQDENFNDIELTNV